MQLFAPIVENAWCLVLAVGFAVLLISAALLVARSERANARMLGFPPTRYPAHQLTASAPMDALAALHTRLIHLQARLPAGSDDARWMDWFARQLRHGMDEAYTRLNEASPAVQAAMLERLEVEVEALAGVVNLQLGATLTPGADRQALEAQLAALRASLR
jgi:hypothetical protein